MSQSSTVERTLAAQALLAAIADRGADAVGYAHRAGSGGVAVHKQRSGASALLDEIAVPAAATQALVHVRDYTKGHPTVDANNHPIRHGRVVGVHNGIIFNDDDLLAAFGIDRAAPEMTVDSEAIFALAELSEGRAWPLERLRGSMAAAWLDERQPELVFLARGVGRPLWLGTCGDASFFASTKLGLELVERYTGVRLAKAEVDEGTLVVLSGGREVRRERFTPNRDFEESPLPPVRAPNEGIFCRARLAALAAAVV